MTRRLPTSLSVVVLGFMAAAVPAAATTTIVNRTIAADELAMAVARDPELTLQSVVVKGDLTLGRATRGLPVPLPFDAIAGTDVTFNGTVTIESSSDADVRLTGATFQRLLVASGRFDEFACVSCTFLGDASFAYMAVRDFELAGSSLNGYADFRGLSSTDRFSIADVALRDRTDFSGVSLATVFVAGLRPSSPVEIEWDAFGDQWLQTQLDYAETQTATPQALRARVEEIETDLRFWKRNFAQAGRERDAREANFEIIKLRRDYLYEPWSWDWTAAWALGLPNRFGTRPYRPFWIALVVIVLFALIYTFSRPFARSDPDKGAVSIAPRPLFALMFSVDKFLPVSATGIKEWGWDIAPERRGIRWLANVESLLGFVVTVLAAFSVGSYLL